MIEIDGISLETEGKDIVVYASIDGTWVEIIRTCQDGMISHAVSSLGITHQMRRQILATTHLFLMGHA